MIFYLKLITYFHRDYCVRAFAHINTVLLTAMIMLQWKRWIWVRTHKQWKGQRIRQLRKSRASFAATLRYCYFRTRWVLLSSQQRPGTRSRLMRGTRKVPSPTVTMKSRKEWKMCPSYSLRLPKSGVRWICFILASLKTRLLKSQRLCMWTEMSIMFKADFHLLPNMGTLGRDTWKPYQSKHMKMNTKGNWWVCFGKLAVAKEFAINAF